jgi:hypothetical protein
VLHSSAKIQTVENILIQNTVTFVDRHCMKPEFDLKQTEQRRMELNFTVLPKEIFTKYCEIF